VSEDTKIQWCDHTFNPWIGCAKVSQACKNCYASVETFPRTQRAKGLELWGENARRHVTSASNWKQPRKWNRKAAESGERRRVFCASLSDVFEDRPDLEAPRIELMELIMATPNLDWLLLTKRPENMVRLFDVWPTWPRNIWAGASYDDKGPERVVELRKVPARIRFLSIEPLVDDPGTIDLEGISWVIVGGESGPKARPFDLWWGWSVVTQCRDAGVPVFFKQAGSRPFFSHLPEHWEMGGGSYSVPVVMSPTQVGFGLKLRDPKGGDLDELPPGLRVREFPEAGDGT
jgi:protein gp37